MSLLFLRPSPPPSLTFIKIFTRGVANVRTPGSRASGGGPARHSNAPKRRRETTPNTTTISSNPSSASAIEPLTPETLAALPPLPYYVGRTPSQQLPIYHLAKRGGNLHQTLVKKIEGNAEALKQELKEHLKLEKGHITVNTINNSIIMKGWLRSEVAQFLRERHF